MTHFANMVEDAYYDDASYSTVTIEYKDHEGVLRSHNVPADRNNTDFAFLQDSEGYDDAMLVKRTEVHKRTMSRTFNASIERAAKDLAEMMVPKIVEQKEREIKARYQRHFEKEKGALEDQVNAAAKRMMSNVEVEGVTSGDYLEIVQNNQNKDSIFQLKLWALELDEVKDADADAKKELRKQQTLLDVLQVLSTIINK